MIKFLDLQKQYSVIKTEIDEAIFRVIEKSQFIGGSEVEEFEKNFAQYCDTDFCVGVGNGTDALEIAIEALNLPRGSEILVPANSFIASAEAVTRNGHKVVFVDCNPDNYTVSLDSIRDKLNPNTRALIAVHLYGHPCDMDAIRKLCGPKVKIVEDCAQAHGAEYMGKKVGSLGDVGAFSFYPGKNLGSYGDAGAITTDDPDLALKCRMIANHGRIAKYDHVMVGRNSRLDTLQAAILNVKLKYIEEWTAQRIKIADIYSKNLAQINNLILPFREPWAKQVYHLYVVRSNKRDELKKYLFAHGIETGIHYPIALPKLEAYEKHACKEDNLFANELASTLLSLPIGEHLSDVEVNLVIKTVNKFTENQC